MKKLLLAAALAATTVAPAFAGDSVLFKQTKYWQIFAYPKTPSCIASTSYPKMGGDTIMLGVNPKGWFLSVYSPTAVSMEVGKQYTMPVVTSLGTSGTYVGNAVHPKQLVFEGLTRADLYSWAKAKSINIVSFGMYNLTGSYEAIMSLGDCGDALAALQNNTVAPQAEAPAPSAPAVQSTNTDVQTLEL